MVSLGDVMKTSHGFSLARAAMVGTLFFTLQHCAIDERKIHGTSEDTTLNGLSSGGTGGSPGAGGAAAGANPQDERGPQPVGLMPTTGSSNAAMGQASGARDAGVLGCADGSTEQCGPELEEGICKFGTRTCSDGVWSACIGAVLPGARDCSSAEDNDCDGQPDNTLDDVCRCSANGTQACEEHPDLDGKGSCRAGIQSCVLGEGNLTSDWGLCSGSVGPSAADSCAVAGDDSNCDGTPNSGCPCVEGQIVPCGPATDAGICQRGTSTCLNGAFGACQGAVAPARRDCRSAQDNDCDGRPDNTIDATCTCAIGAVQACGTHPGRDGFGPCNAGSQTCVAANQNATSGFGACTGAVGPAQRDSCTVLGDDADCNNSPNSGCECVGSNQPCAADPESSRCNAQGQCAPCQSNADCSLVSGGRNRCTAGVCSAPRCGDGIVQPERGETCDDSNTVNGDGCSEICVAGRAPRGGTSFASNHLCAVLPSGAVKCWGLNFAGQLGDGSISTGSAASPPGLVSVIVTAVDVALMGDSTCAALRDGTVSCWGSGFGSRPVPVSGVTGVTQIAGGDGLFCGRQTSGAVICWATDGVAQQAPGLAMITQVARGDRHSCALRSDGILFCSGGNTEGEGGRGIFGDRAETPLAATVFRDVVDVATGYRSTCVRTRASSNVQCLGERATAGSPTALPSGNAEPVTALSLGNAVKVVAGEQHMCALTADDAIRCWGTGLAVGNGDADGSATPVTVPLPGPAVDVGAGTFTSCALLQDSSVYCWGNFAVTGASGTPVLVPL
jgi:cysteine-rich repeat protein